MIPIIEAGLAIIDKLIPDPVARQAAKIRLIEIQQAGQLAEQDATLKLATGQLRSTRWRPPALTGSSQGGARPWAGSALGALPT